MQFGSDVAIQIFPAGKGILVLRHAQHTDQHRWIRVKRAKEGQLFNADTMTIPAAGAHPGNAMLFIDYMLNAENMTKNVSYISYPVPTTAGMAAYDALVADVPFLKVDTESLSDTSAWQQGLTATQRTLWQQAWLKVQG